MKYFFSFFLITLICTQAYSQDSNCLRKNLPAFFELNNKQLELWRKDTNGCLGYREKYIDSIGSNKNLIGMPKKVFFVLFGKPDASSSDEIYTYFAGYSCDPKRNHLEKTNFIHIIFIFIGEKLASISFSMS